MARQTRLMTSLVALAAAGSLLAACDQQQAPGVPPIGSLEASMGLEAGPPPPMAYGPGADALDRGQPIRVTALGPAPERYRYIDDAYEMVDAFGDSPPDYAFDYGGVEPWVWRSDGGYYRVVEAIPDGYREYYYGPQGDEPFLVRDPRYSYAYDGGALVAVYDIYGRVQPASFVTRQADYAGRYYARARTLHVAALHQERRRPYADQWQERRQALAAPRQRWAQERDRDTEWRRLREQRPEAQQAVWSHERQQRDAARAEQPRKPNSPMFGAREAPRAMPLARPDRIARDERQVQDQARTEIRRSDRLSETPRQAQRADTAQQHAAQASAREAARGETQQRHAQQQQAERQRGEARQAQAERQQAQVQQQAQAQQRGQARQAERAQAQQTQERARAEPRQDRPKRAEAPNAQAPNAKAPNVPTPNAQAHGRPDAAQPRNGPTAQHGGPKGDPKDGDKHDRR